MTVRSMYVYNGSSWDEVGYTIAHGVPAGGASSAILSKSSATDYDTAWVAAEGWVTPIRTSGGYVAKTALYTATNDDRVINCTSGTYTITLPTAVSQAGREFVINNSGSGVITVDGASAETVAGAATQVLSGRGRLRIVSDGSNWVVIDGSYADETVGRRLFQWDANNSRWQMTYGDTGWRDVTGSIAAGLHATNPTLVLYVRRHGSLVSWLLFEAAAGTATGLVSILAAVPAGFNQTPTVSTYAAYPLMNYATGAITLESVYMSSFDMNTAGWTTIRHTGSWSYTTTDAWPTTLPGTASGSIPA